MPAIREYRRTGKAMKGHTPPSQPHVREASVSLDADLFEAIVHLACSRRMTGTAFIRQLIEIGLHELQEKGDACLTLAVSAQLAQSDKARTSSGEVCPDT